MANEIVLSSPDPDAPPDVLADWLELLAFIAEDGRSFLRKLSHETDLAPDYESDDWTDTETLLEDVASQAAAEIDQRAQALGAAYPFDLSENGDIIKFSQEWEFGAIVYIFCLILSHVSRSPLVPEGLAPTRIREARDLFQVCATLGAAGFCGGPAFSFGWPRPDRSQFLNKLHEIYTIFGDGTPRADPPPGSPKQVKDDGIDVISWRQAPDERLGDLYLLGQAASGHNWSQKSIKTVIDVFHQEWFEVQPASPPSPAMFIPFYVIGNEMRRRTRQLGHIIDRIRLPYYAAKVPDLVRRGVAPIERHENITDIEAWVRDHRLETLKIMSS